MKKNPCTPHEVLDLSIKLLDLEVKPIAANSGVSESQISRYRKGKADMGTDSFARLIRALPEKARAVVSESLIRDLTFEQVVFSLNE